jgi:HD-GYP domain-containing protein (c-di-GMP phosphodiesterase class II)
MPALTRRERVAELVVGGGFAAACVVLFLTVSSDHPFELAPTILAVLALALASRIRFPVHEGFTVPIVLVFVPTLFLVPLPLVAPVTALALALGAAPDVLRRRVPPTRLLFAAANSWFSIGPVIVLGLAGVTEARDAPALVLLGALAAQFATDLGASALRERIVQGATLREQVTDVLWVYAVDAALAPIGLLAAMAAPDPHYSILLLVPLLGLLRLFATERRQRFESISELSSAYRGTALVLADVVEADDTYTGEHCRDVVELSLAVAEAMALTRVQRRNVEFGALLHDVGKVAIPKEIINKAGPLDAAEWEIIRTHTIEGHRMLDQVGGIMREVGLVVRASHERWDGGGYPDGLAGEDIPVEARIVSCCDTYSAMTTTRSYRPAMTAEAALAELRACAGTQLDPAVVDVLIACVGANDAAPAPTPARAPAPLPRGGDIPEPA